MLVQLGSVMVRLGFSTCQNATNWTVTGQIELDVPQDLFQWTISNGYLLNTQWNTDQCGCASSKFDVNWCEKIWKNHEKY